MLRRAQFRRCNMRISLKLSWHNTQYLGIECLCRQLLGGRGAPRPPLTTANAQFVVLFLSAVRFFPRFLKPARRGEREARTEKTSRFFSFFFFRRSVVLSGCDARQRCEHGRTHALPPPGRKVDEQAAREIPSVHDYSRTQPIRIEGTSARTRFSFRAVAPHHTAHETLKKQNNETLLKKKRKSSPVVPRSHCDPLKKQNNTPKTKQYRPQPYLGHT